MWLCNAIYILEDTQPDLVYLPDYDVPTRIRDNFIEDLTENVLPHYLQDHGDYSKAGLCLDDALRHLCLQHLQRFRQSVFDRFVGFECYSFADEADDIVIEVFYE